MWIKFVHLSIWNPFWSGLCVILLVKALKQTLASHCACVHLPIYPDVSAIGSGLWTQDGGEDAVGQGDERGQVGMLDDTVPLDPDTWEDD